MKHLKLLRDHLHFLSHVFGIVRFVPRDVFDILFVQSFLLAQVSFVALLVFPHMLLKSQLMKATQLDCYG